MSFYGKIAGGLTALVLVGVGASYVASVGSGVLAAAEQTAADLSCYVVREYNGTVALFRDGSEEPLTVYSTQLEELSPMDAELLREGIRLRGIAEVSRLLEDLEIE